MEITANAVQSVLVNNNVIFTDTVIPGNCSIMHREDSGLIKLRGLTTTQSRARFRVNFNANIGIPTGETPGPISLALTIDGEPVPTSKMIVTPAAVNEFFNIAASLHIDVPAGCCASIGVTNSDGPTISVQNANLIVERVA